MIDKTQDYHHVYGPRCLLSVTIPISLWEWDLSDPTAGQAAWASPGKAESYTVTRLQHPVVGEMPLRAATLAQSGTSWPL